MCKKIVVTGATGFIGKALCEALEKIENYSIIKVTRLQNKKGFFVVDNYQEAPTGDVLIHLGEGSNRENVNEIGDIYRQETANVVENLLKHKYEAIIYCSSSVVYGDKGVEPYKENMKTYPDDTYSRAKIKNEKRVLNAGGTVVRFSNVIGFGMSVDNVLSDIAKQLPKSGFITVRNSRPIKDFIWIEDVVNALILLIKNPTPGIFNVGTGVATSIHELTEIFLDISSQKNRKINSIVASPSYSYNVINIEKMKRMLNWEPRILLPHSIKNIVKEL
jgi:UDP-glucose 4-epimerase